MATRAMLKKADFFMYTGFDYILRFTRILRDRGSSLNMRRRKVAAKIRNFSINLGQEKQELI